MPVIFAKSTLRNRICDLIGASVTLPAAAQRLTVVLLTPAHAANVPTLISSGNFDHASAVLSINSLHLLCSPTPRFHTKRPK
jgi:hypothetical protein